MISRGKAEKQAARTKRLSAALRENLKRRKAQARTRAEQGVEEDASPSPASTAATKGPDFRRNPGGD
jgi:hypothetical protein